MVENCQKSNSELLEKIRTPVSVVTPGLEHDWKHSAIVSPSVDSNTMEPDEVKTPTFVPEGTPPQKEDSAFEAPVMSASETPHVSAMQLVPSNLSHERSSSFDQYIPYVDSSAPEMKQEESFIGKFKRAVDYDLTPHICSSTPAPGPEVVRVFGHQEGSAIEISQSETPRPALPISYTDSEMEISESNLHDIPLQPASVENISIEDPKSNCDEKVRTCCWMIYIFLESCFSHVKECCASVRCCTAFPSCLRSLDADEEDPTSNDSKSGGLSSIVLVPFRALSVVGGKIVEAFNWGFEKYNWFKEKYSGYNAIFKAFLLGVTFYTIGLQIEVWFSTDLVVAQMKNDGPHPWYDCSFCAGLTPDAIVIAPNIVGRVKEDAYDINGIQVASSGEGTENTDFVVGGKCKTFGGNSASGNAYYTKEDGYYEFGANSHPLPKAFMIVSVFGFAVVQLIFWVFDDFAPWVHDYWERDAPNQWNWRKTLAAHAQTFNDSLSAQSPVHKSIFTKELIEVVVYMIHFILYFMFYCVPTLATGTQIKDGCWVTKGFFRPVWLMRFVYVFMGIVGVVIVAFILLIIFHQSYRSRPEYRFWLSFSAQCLIMVAAVVACIVGGIGMINAVVDDPLLNIPSLLYAFCIFAYQVKNAVSARRSIVEVPEDTSAPAENESEVATPAVQNESGIASAAEQTHL